MSQQHALISDIIRALQPPPSSPHDNLHTRTNLALEAVLSDIVSSARALETLTSHAPYFGKLHLVIKATIQQTNKTTKEIVLYTPPTPRATPESITDPGPISSATPSEQSPHLAPNAHTFPFTIVATALRYLLDGCGATRHKKFGQTLGYDNIRRNDVNLAFRSIINKYNRKSLCQNDLLPAIFRGKSATFRAPKVISIDNSHVSESHIMAKLQHGRWLVCDKDALFLQLCAMLQYPQDDVVVQVLKLHAAQGMGIDGCIRFGLRCSGRSCPAVVGSTREFQAE